MIFPLELPSILPSSAVEEITRQFEDYLQQGLVKMVSEFTKVGTRKISGQSISNFSDSSTNDGHSVGNSRAVKLYNREKRIPQVD